MLHQTGQALIRPLGPHNKLVIYPRGSRQAQQSQQLHECFVCTVQARAAAAVACAVCDCGGSRLKQTVCATCGTAWGGGSRGRLVCIDTNPKPGLCVAAGRHGRNPAGWGGNGAWQHRGSWSSRAARCAGDASRITAQLLTAMDVVQPAHCPCPCPCLHACTWVCLLLCSARGSLSRVCCAVLC